VTLALSSVAVRGWDVRVSHAAIGVDGAVDLRLLFSGARSRCRVGAGSTKRYSTLRMGCAWGPSYRRCWSAASQVLSSTRAVTAWTLG